MIPTFTHTAAQVAARLRSFLSLCEQALALANCESHALSATPEYQPAEFSQRRKGLLASLDQAVADLKQIRCLWLQTDPAQRNQCDEVKSLFQAVQGALMKLLLLDRENQQAMLRRGLVPAQHLPPPAAQRPHFVTGLYRKHSLV